MVNKPGNEGTWFADADQGGGDLLTTIAAMVAAAVAQSQVPQRDAAPNATKVEVNPENVLAAGKVIQEQTEQLRAKLESLTGRLQIRQSGMDPVSVEAASAWNWRLVNAEDSHVARVEQYVVNLANLSGQLREAAAQYGYNDEEIATGFGERRG
ncbi:hypothetical protein EV191_103199 [Tamaricihabitans halophyticus]|uniref:PE family protein n=1 Tax=Tamaricihabitans halophyticus TaxID=1262583 RepID=A0A4R2QYN2_9PSEU|nr:hypothetical protein [Tamaricihabitans halophyticus]TCP54158.1 hypothetical protein EV191_103199 [Tamaricihabitans halophyticus]